MATATSQIAGNGYSEGAVYTAAADPVATNDAAHNYQVGDVIVNTTSGLVFICTVNTTSGAVWLVKDVIAQTLVYNVPAANVPFFVAPRACTVLAILNRVEISGTGGACTAVVKKAASGTAMSAGTALHTGSIDLVGTVSANGAALTLASAATLAIPAGTAIGVTVTGTATSAIGCITVLLLPA